MAYIKNFEKPETKHQRMSQVPTSNYDPWDNPTVKPSSKNQNDFFHEHIKQYSDLIAWMRWFPDLFLDLLNKNSSSLDEVLKTQISNISLQSKETIKQIIIHMDKNY